MQDGATASVLRRDGTQNSCCGLQTGEHARDVNVRVMTEVRIRQILTHQSSPGECALTGGMFERFGLAAQRLGCRAHSNGNWVPSKPY